MISPNTAAVVTVGGFTVVSLIVLLFLEVFSQQRLIRSQRKLIEDLEARYVEDGRLVELLFAETDELTAELEWMNKMMFGPVRAEPPKYKEREVENGSEG